MRFGSQECQAAQDQIADAGRRPIGYAGADPQREGAFPTAVTLGAKPPSDCATTSTTVALSAASLVKPLQRDPARLDRPAPQYRGRLLVDGPRPLQHQH